VGEETPNIRIVRMDRLIGGIPMAKVMGSRWQIRTGIMVRMVMVCIFAMLMYVLGDMKHSLHITQCVDWQAKEHSKHVSKKRFHSDAVKILRFLQ
jgi:hypothetical protein